MRERERDENSVYNDLDTNIPQVFSSSSLIVGQFSNKTLHHGLTEKTRGPPLEGNHIVFHLCFLLPCTLPLDRCARTPLLRHP